jgi:hypothetical protein
MREQNLPLVEQSYTNAPRLYLFWGLVIPLIIYAARSVPLLLDPNIPFDTTYTYFPLARQLLAEGASFWQDPITLKSAPGIYTYMALADVDLVSLKIIDLMMALSVVTMLSDIAWRIAGNVAAGATAWLIAVSPLILPLSISPMAEPPAFFLLALWLWATTCCLQIGTGQWLRYALVVFAGIALAAATLTRATTMYWIPAFVLLSVIALLIKGPIKALLPWKRLLAIHLIALLGVGVYMVKNQVDFGKPLIATGAGAALYFGNNVLTYGQEPPFFGLQHDEILITRGVSHLSMDGDHRLSTAAVERITAASFPALAATYINDAGSLLFFSKSHLRNYSDRIWRICLVTLAVIGVWFGRRHPIVIFTGGLALYMWAVHLPALYNPRYSILALDVEFSLLAGIGVAGIWQQTRRKSAILGTLLVMSLGIVVGSAHQRYSSAMQVNFTAMPPPAIQMATPTEVLASGFSTDPFTTLATTTSQLVSLKWTRDFPEVNGLMLVHLGIEKLTAECTKAWVSYTNAAGMNRIDFVRIASLSQGQHFSRGLAHVASPGPGNRLEITLACTQGAQIQLSSLGLYDASFGKFARINEPLPGED